jgi:hypothetical protein
VIWLSEIFTEYRTWENLSTYLVCLDSHSSISVLRKYRTLRENQMSSTYEFLL